MKPIQAVIFDLDGTLIDTLDDITLVCNTVLARMGKPVLTREEYRPWIGKGLEHLLLSIIHDETLLEELWDNLFQLYKEAPVQHSKVYDGMAETLQFLEEKKIPVAILSNKEEVLVKKIIDILIPDFPFFMVRGWNDNFPTKPDPAQALYIAKQMHIEPESIAFVGDSLFDVETAINAGMMSIAVSWGYGTTDSITKAEIVSNNVSDFNTTLREYIS